MKKSLLCLTILLVLFSVNIFAQDVYNYRYGIKLGINFAKIVGDDADNFKSATGLNIGVLVRKQFNDYAYFQVEALLSEKGARDNQPIDSTNVEVTWFLNYFEIPFLIGIDLFNNSDSPVNPVFYGGGFIAIKSTSKIRGDFEDTYNELTYQEAKAFDYGFILGGSLEFEIQESRIILDLRFTKSATSFDDIQLNPWDLRNQVISATIGYIF